MRTLIMRRRPGLFVVVPRWHMVALLLTIVAGCDNASAPGGGVAVRDSSGVRIVEAAFNAAALEQWRLDDEPAFTVGAADGSPDQLLYRVQGARRLPDGSVAILNAGSHEVRIYDAAGTLRSTAGRRGGGPGEFDFPLGFGVFPPDTLVVYDATERRVSLFLPDGSFVDSRSAAMGLSGLNGFLDAETAVLSAPASTPRSQRDLVTRYSFVVRVVSLATGAADTVATVDGAETLQTVIGGERIITTPVPFTANPSTRVFRGEIHVVDPVHPEVRIYGRDGRLARILRTGLPARAMDRGEFERELADALDAVEPAARRAAARLADQAIAPAARPFFDRLVIADNGETWLRIYEPPTAAAHDWLVLDRAGAPFAQVSVPATFWIYQVVDDHVLARHVDGLGVEYVRLHRVTRAGPQSEDD
jgi:hypothetical protein